jgi:hypothetical protein
MNDADNGVYLPRFKSTVVASLPTAHKHSGLHTELYHLEVFARLRRVPAAFANHEQGRIDQWHLPVSPGGHGMTVWELRNADVNDHAVLVLPIEDEAIDTDKVFGGSGAPLSWRKKRRLDVFIDKRRKTAKPRADISAFLPGSLVLNERAFEVLGTFLGQFGQLLPLAVDGQTEYFYNVTNVVRCVDVGRSQKYPEGTVSREAFDAASVPRDAAVFKDPSTAPVRIYVNEAGKVALRELIDTGRLSGLEMVSAGL